MLGLVGIDTELSVLSAISDLSSENMPRLLDGSLKDTVLFSCDERVILGLVGVDVLFAGL